MFCKGPWIVGFSLTVFFSFTAIAKTGRCQDQLKRVQYRGNQGTDYGEYRGAGYIWAPDARYSEYQGVGFNSGGAQVSTLEQESEVFSYRSLLEVMRRSSEFFFRSQSIQGFSQKFIAIEQISEGPTGLLGSWATHQRPLHIQANLELLAKDEDLALALMRSRGQVLVENEMGVRSATGERDRTVAANRGGVGGEIGTLTGESDKAGVVTGAGKELVSPLALALMDLRDQYFLEQNVFYLMILTFLKKEEVFQSNSMTLDWLFKIGELGSKPGDRKPYLGVPLHAEIYLTARERGVILVSLFDHLSAHPWRRAHFDRFMTQIGELLFGSLSRNLATKLLDAKDLAGINPTPELIALRSLVHFNQDFWNHMNQLASPLQFSKTQWLDPIEKANQQPDLVKSINRTGLKNLLPKLYDPRVFYRNSI